MKVNADDSYRAEEFKEELKKSGANTITAKEVKERIGRDPGMHKSK